jgi:hypothetical protein
LLLKGEWKNQRLGVVPLRFCVLSLAIDVGEELAEENWLFPVAIDVRPVLCVWWLFYFVC